MNKTEMQARIIALEAEVKELKQHSTTIILTKNELEDHLAQLRNKRKALGAKPFKYDDDKSKMLSLDVQIGDVLLQLEEMK